IEQVDALVSEVQDGQLRLDQVLACALYTLKEYVFAGDRSLFVAHCESVYKYKAAYAYRLAQAGRVYISLSQSTIVEKELWPKSISQAVALSKIGDEQLVELWQSLCEAGEQKTMNCDKLNCYVQDVIDKNNAAKMIEEPPELQQTRVPDAVDEVAGTETDTPSVVETSVQPEDKERYEPQLCEESLEVEEPYHSRDYGYGTPNDFPPFGIDRENRMVMAAVGVKFFRLVHEKDGPCIMEWDEECCGWQQLLPVQNGTLAIWEDLIKKPGVCQC
ncbi:MAG: hypothetical protein D3910_26715, partial [Candidatus Electrothrix sp. ATG2]|nr:hypothetical protein [Candidatus Electrothrix sp. ATG2]